jgi:hypothetical protein
MSTREKIKLDIDNLPEESLEAVSEFIAGFFIISAPPQKCESKREEAFKTLQKYVGSIDRTIDYKKERLEYLDEKYGRVD